MSRIINSPGIQITEKDLSLRSTLPAGTQVFIPGFAAQGPTAESLMITTVSELEATYGIPTTPAERYFYYSCKEVLNSPCVLNAMRLPYGNSSGTAYSKYFSGLFYPAALTTTDGVSSWNVKPPVHVSLTEKQYSDIKAGNFDWGITDPTQSILEVNSTAYYSGSASTDTYINAGFIILNDLQTAINEVGEGYYVGIADNTAVSTDSPDFNSVKQLLSLSGNDTFAPIPVSRLDFTLSATKVESENGKGSVSELLEKVGFVGFAEDSYQDHLSIGVFKIRRSTADASKLTLATTETYLGSLNSTRKQVSQSGGVLQNAFVGDIINNASSSVKVYVNPTISQKFSWNTNSTIPTSRITIETGAKAVYPVGVFASATASAETSKIIGQVPLKLEKAFRAIENTDTYTVDVVADAGLSTVYALAQYSGMTAGVSAFNDETYVANVSSVQDDWHTVANTIINFAENNRRDCFAIIDPLRNIFVTGRDSKVIEIEGNSFTENIYKPLRDFVGPIETNYAAVYANWVKNNDIFSGRRCWLPFSGYAAAIIGRTDSVAYPWSAPAGLTRGVFGNALDIAINPNQKQRDRLYEIATNPVVYFIGEGYAVYGQKTLQNKPTAFDRINVRRLFLALERAVSRTIKFFVFEPNTNFTRSRVVNTISPIFNQAKITEGLYDYLIVCDERNNTPDTIDNNELIVDIYLKPVRTAEFILINFIATRTSQSFTELI